MPKVIANGKTIECPQGTNLRQLLLQHGIELYNGNSKFINCRGLGSCGTCAVEISGEVSPPNWKEKARLSLPPHSPERGLRLACQTKVLGDITVKKYDQFWGQGSQVKW